MNESQKQALASFRTVMGFIALALALAALVKLVGGAGVLSAIPGNVEQLALVAIACKMA